MGIGDSAYVSSEYHVNYGIQMLDSALMEHPFDRYADYTDLAVLKEFSGKPLRKCMRVNTLKMEVGEFEHYAKDQNWNLLPILWSDEGFFIDREDRSKALGKDLLHLLGYTYMQEASSMLPVALLDPKPGDTVLDMAAAPGSKSTQIAARMNCQGVIVANDMKENRLHTLMTALHRLGVTNAIVTKKMGQWFGKNMTGRFNRVLIDAPCTGQGTSRKDSSALTYCSTHSIGKNAKLQRELLEAAVHAASINGRIVYSTCTLTPEENEDVVHSILEKYPDQLEVVDPRTIVRWDCSQAIEDSNRVQKSIGKEEMPMLRIWPQTYDSEGFFSAVLTKTAPTIDAVKVDLVQRTEDILPKSRVREICEFLEGRFGIGFKNENETILQSNERLWIVHDKTLKFKMPCPHFGIGLPFGKLLSKSPVMIDHDLATLRGSSVTDNVIDLTGEQWNDILRGQDIDCDPELLGNILLRYNGMCVSRGRARDGRCKNHLPRWIVQMSQ